MREIKDFHCTYDNAAGICPEVTAGLGLAFPDAYLHCDTMAVLSKAVKEYEGAAFCTLPFCHTVEAEALGAVVNYGDARTGPRAGGYVCTAPEQLLERPPIDLENGRIHEVLLACRALREEGEHVVLEVSGPFTILNSLIDGRHVFKALRKKPELMAAVFDRLGEELLRYIKEAVCHGADLISYADSAGGVNILGPALTARITEEFTYPFLRKARDAVKGRGLLLLCPKTTFALTGTGKARFVEKQLPGPMRYGEACIEMIGQAELAGQTCIKNVDYRLESGVFQAVELREPADTSLGTARRGC